MRKSIEAERISESLAEVIPTEVDSSATRVVIDTARAIGDGTDGQGDYIVPEFLGMLSEHRPDLVQPILGETPDEPDPDVRFDLYNTFLRRALERDFTGQEHHIRLGILDPNETVRGLVRDIVWDVYHKDSTDRSNLGIERLARIVERSGPIDSRA